MKSSGSGDAGNSTHADEQRLYPKVRFRGFDEPWKKVKLGEIATTYSGGTPKAGNKKYYNGLIPFIRSGEIHSNKTELFISEAGLKNSSAKMVTKGDLLYALYGATSGEVDISKINGAINQAVLAIIPKQYNPYIISLLLSKKKDAILSKYLQGGQGNLSAEIVKSIKLILPSKNEESSLYPLFKVLDNLLSLQHRKMELENQTSKAIYNYLFDKNKPFYFKDNKTKKVFLKELGTTYSGLSGKNKTDFGHGKAKYITYLNVNKNTIANHNLLDLIEIDKKQNEVLNGDILFTISSETPEEVGLASLWPYDDTNIYLNSFCFGFRPNSKINNLWLAYELRSLKIRKNMYKLAQGISRYNLSKKSVLNLQVDVPSDAEQNFDSKFVKLINIQTKFLSNERNELLLLKKFLLQNLFI
ncbi:restriction endonuclease subunit S [Lactobacillus jensenii]|nr:restriction endonuclease subunit S [Lactobacillus jensenii]MDT9586606.1 restriction endonuclease subunit S [Lactobacillus jensenii]